MASNSQVTAPPAVIVRGEQCREEAVLARTALASAGLGTVDDVAAALAGLVRLSVDMRLAPAVPLVAPLNATICIAHAAPLVLLAVAL